MESLLLPEMCLSLVIFLLFGINAGALAVDNFGLLYGVLRTFQAHACDGEELRLNCTPNTVISVNLVRYGMEAGREDLCPGNGGRGSSACRVDSALKVIEARCRGQVLCRLLISPGTFQEDPCPGVRKFAEVAYKCRPEHFRNKIVCEGQRLNLNCPAGQSVTIYSAAFGTTRSEVAECRQPAGIYTNDCQVSYATEIMMRHCNGHASCTVLVNTTTFGERNCIGRKHLKVTYNCVSSNVLKFQPTKELLSDFEETIHTTSFPGWVRAYDQPRLNSLQKTYDTIVRTSTMPSNAFQSEMQSDEVPLDGSKIDRLEGNQKLVGFMSQLISAHKYIASNKDKLILYMTLSVGIGFMVFVTVFIARFLVNIKLKHDSKTNIVPVADDPFFTDSDLEQYNPTEELPPPVINYSASLRRQSSDVQPRTPVTNGTELNHYFS